MSTTPAARSPPPPPYSPLAHNCSGKHAGMLACCVLHGWPTDGYLDPAHPLQAAIRAAVARRDRRREDDLVAGIDGCSAPNYALPLAGARARLCRPRAPRRRRRGRGRARDDARRHDARARTTCPGTVAATSRSTRAGRGDWVAKVGAEGVQAIGLASRRARHRDQGGATARAGRCSPAAIAVLDALGVLDRDAREALAAQARAGAAQCARPGRRPDRALRGPGPGRKPGGGMNLGARAWSVLRSATAPGPGAGRASPAPIRAGAAPVVAAGTTT